MPTPTPTPDCVHVAAAWINFPGFGNNTEEVDAAELVGEITDSGPRDLAAGEPTLNDAGEIVSYTVQPGDAVDAIATRFCIDRYSFKAYNDTSGWDVQPGDVLVLRP